MSRELKQLCRRVEELYRASTGRLSYPACQSLRDRERPALLEELDRLAPDLSDREPIMKRLDEALANLQAQLDHYEALNRKWNQPVRPPELRHRLH
jgi:hypothetical protein